MAAGAFSWRGIMRHETHAHPFFGPVDGVTAGSFAVPTMGHDFSGNVSYEVICTVTDSNGLASNSSVQLTPEEVNLTFQTVPAGLNVLLGGVTRTTPFTIDAAIGFQFQIEAPDQTSGGAPYVFSSWSDGGARTHGLSVGTSDQTLVATFEQPPDTTAPTVSVTAPSAGATLSGTATVSANASDSVGVAGVQFLLDGNALGCRGHRGAVHGGVGHDHGRERSARADRPSARRGGQRHDVQPDQRHRDQRRPDRGLRLRRARGAVHGGQDRQRQQRRHLRCDVVGERTVRRGPELRRVERPRDRQRRQRARPDDGHDARGLGQSRTSPRTTGARSSPRSARRTASPTSSPPAATAATAPPPASTPGTGSARCRVGPA